MSPGNFFIEFHLILKLIKKSCPVSYAHTISPVESHNKSIKADFDLKNLKHHIKLNIILAWSRKKINSKT